MAYDLKGGEEWVEGILHGWTGKKCSACGGCGETNERKLCNNCGGTGDDYGVMPIQPAVN